jgi:hypothetical protein
MTELMRIKEDSLQNDRLYNTPDRSTRIVALGRRRISDEAYPCILFTTSRPSTTSPNTTFFPSHQGPAVVVIKNYDVT